VQEVVSSNLTSPTISPEFEKGWRMAAMIEMAVSTGPAMAGKREPAARAPASAAQKPTEMVGVARFELAASTSRT
jgi:hypothetical protein